MHAGTSNEEATAGNCSRPEGDKNIVVSPLWPGFPVPQVPADTSDDQPGGD